VSIAEQEQRYFECDLLNICFLFFNLEERNYFERIYMDVNRFLQSRTSFKLIQRNINLLVYEEGYEHTYKFLGTGYRDIKGTAYAIKDNRSENSWIILIAKTNLQDSVLTKYLFFHELAHCLYDHNMPDEDRIQSYWINEEIEADKLAIDLLKSTGIKNEELFVIANKMFDKQFKGYTKDDFELRKNSFKEKISNEII
jgi:hypothetical protein